MTWTLRFYDENGDEIGYAEKPDVDTYNYEITHSDSKWDRMGQTLAALERVTVNVEETLPETDWGTFNPGPTDRKLPPKEHLEEVRAGVNYDGIDDTTLKDE